MVSIAKAHSAFTSQSITAWERVVSVYFFMVALCNRADHIYFHPVSFFFFFPRLISAVEDWMSTILRHMVWS